MVRVGMIGRRAVESPSNRQKISAKTKDTSEIMMMVAL